MKKQFLIKVSIIFALCTLFAVASLSAAWLDNVPNSITQPDGTVVDVLLSGDEFYNWAHDENGYTIVQDEQTGYWCWAMQSRGGDITSSGFPIHQYSPQSRNLSPKINISNERYREKRHFMESTRNNEPVRTPTSGTFNNLVVFIKFSDDPEFSSPHTYSYYDDQFNGAGVGVNSLYQYFKDSSYDELTVNTHFYPPPSGNSVVSYTSTNPRNYYRPYNATTNPIGYTGGDNGTQRREREHALLRDAVAHISTMVPSTLNIDADNDGFVDNIAFMVKGQPGAWSSLLWPHMWSLYTYNVYLHSKRVYVYNFNIEFNSGPEGSFSGGVSTYCHEFAHSLGIPDLYRYYSNGTPVGVWDLMASTTSDPQSISAYMKWRYTDWVTTLPQITANGTYTLYPNTVSQTNHAYRINSPNSTTDYFVVEYRSNNTGYIDSSLPGSGLIVYRINSTIGGGVNDGNANGPPDEVYVYRPGGTYSNHATNSDGTINNAFFNSTVGRTQINDTTNPSAWLSNGTAGGLNISNIGTAGTTISFTVGTSSFNPPQSFTATPGNQQVVLAWTAPQSGSGGTLANYKIYRSTSSTFTPSAATIVYTTTNATTLTWTNTGLTNDTDYYYKIVASYINSTGDSSPLNANPYPVRPNNNTQHILFTENFENATTFNADWTVVNGTQPNKWYRGNATHNGGSNSIYVSNNNGTSNAYSGNESVVHFYRDISIPAGAVNVRLSFDFKGVGETGYHRMRVFLCNDTFVPSAGTLPTGTEVGTDYSEIPTWTNQSINILSTLVAGQTKRLVFTWENDTYAAQQPPAAVDNITLTYEGTIAPTEVYVGDQSSTTVSQSFINWYYTDSVSQTIFLSSELPYGTIHSLKFRFNGAGNVTNTNVTLYMATTTNSSFSSASSWVPFSSFTQVYSGNMAVTTSGQYDVTVTLETPFNYNSGNLVLMAHRDDTVYYGSSSTNTWQVTGSTNRTLSVRQDNSNYNLSSLPAGTLNAHFINTTFSFQSSGSDVFNPPQNFTATPGSQQVLLSWTAPLSGSSGTLANYKIYRSTSSTYTPSSTTLVHTTTNATTLSWSNTGLTNGTSYYYKIVASYTNTAGESSPVNANLYPVIPAIPNAPQNFTASPGNQQVVLTWEAPEVAQPILLLVDNDDNMKDSEILIKENDYSSLLSRNDDNDNDDGGTTRALGGYKIYRGTTSTFTPSTTNLVQTITNSGTMTWTNTGLTNGTSYYYKIVATYTNPTGESNPVNATPYPVVPTTPDAPENFTATPGNQQVILSWNAPTNAPSLTLQSEQKSANSKLVSKVRNNEDNDDDTVTRALGGYKIYRSTTSTFTPSTTNLVQTITNSTTTTWTNTGLTNGTSYYYKIVATYTNPTGESNPVNATPYPVIPNQSVFLPPQSFTATPGNLQVTLYWTASQTGSSGTLSNFKIYRGTTSSFTPSSANLIHTTTNATTTTWVNTGLTYGTNYYYKIVASYTNQNGDSVPLNATPYPVTTLPPTFNPPQNLTAQANHLTNGNSRVVLTWSAPITGSSGTRSGYKLYKNGVLKETLSASTITYNDTDVSNGIIYTYYITAIYTSPDGESPFSNVVQVVPTPPVAQPPQNLTATAEIGGVRLTWQAPATGSTGTLSSYKVTRNGQVIYTGSNLQHNDTSGIYGNLYTYYVNAVYTNPTSESVASNTVQAMPLIEFLSPANLICELEDNNIILSWERPNSAFVLGYNIYRDNDPEPIGTTAIETFIEYDMSGGTYIYSVKTIYLTGESEPIFTQIVVSDEDISMLQTVPALLGNYPNPFNPSTTISFNVGANNNSPVQIEIYNIKGQKVRSLVNGVFDTGIQSVFWNGTDDNGNGVPSGLYFCMMRTEGVVQTKRMLLLK